MKAVLVIDMPDNLKNNLDKVKVDVIGTLNGQELFHRLNQPLKPLPDKKHGRLIDADAYLKKVCTYRETGGGSCRFQTVCPVDEPTIIEADTGETE